MKKEIRNVVLGLLRDPEVLEAVRLAVGEIRKPAPAKPYKPAAVGMRVFGSERAPNRLAERKEYGEESRAEREAREAAEEHDDEPEAA